MQQTIEATSKAAATAKSHVEALGKRLNHLLTFVPDDKLTWAPSSTSKSCLRVAAHCALVNRFFANTISGNMPEPMPSPEDFFKSLYQAEEKITTRESVTALAKETTTELSMTLQAVSEADMSSTSNSPFGPLPMDFWLDQCVEHLAKHIGQVEYVQTIWGDLDNHLG